ncbi:ABC transporter substrate-binding protein [Streptomyces sp. NPDC051940]|uniref:ABC transporter substrate-binding protein n=1 Tax=Streptomyces sp. NPDC051940 TaxID=3155675 RepID=UPI0034403DFA
MVGTTDAVSALDPAAAYDAPSWAILSTLHQSLLTFKPSGSEPVPDAAKSCDFTDETLKVYECTLRDDLKFSNGNKLTSEDVVFSLERVKAYFKKSDGDGPWPVISTLDKVEEDGPDKVIFHLTTADATWPFKLASTAGAIVDHTVYPKDGPLKGSGVVGSGPYILKSYDEGKSAVLERNPDYKGRFEVRNDGVEIKYFPTPEKLHQAWQDKKLDVASRDMTSKMYKDIEDNPKDDVRVSSLKGTSLRHLVFNSAPASRTKDVAVRRAAAALIDREQLASEVHLRTVEPLYSLIPAGIAGHTTAFYDKLPKKNPAAARKILQEAGIQTPYAFTLGYRADAGFEDETKALVKQLETGGLFKITEKPIPSDKFFGVVSSGEEDAFTVGWLPDYPDPDTYVSPIVGKTNAYNNGYESPVIEDAIKDSLKVSQRTRALPDYQAIDEKAAEDVPVLPLYQAKDYTLTTDHILGGENLLDSTGAWRVWELGRE